MTPRKSSGVRRFALAVDDEPPLTREADGGEGAGLGEPFSPGEVVFAPEPSHRPWRRPSGKSSSPRRDRRQRDRIKGI